MVKKTNFFVVSVIAMMAVGQAVADTPATQEWTKNRYDSKISTINQRLATDVRDKVYTYDSNKNSPTYQQVLDPLNTNAETAFAGINEVLEKVDGNDGSANSAVTLDTTAQNAFGAINELKGAIDAINIPEQVNADWNAESGAAQILHKPEIPAAQIQSDWTQNNENAVDYIKHKPTLAAVATSGSYNDLTNKPTIPDVSDFVTETALGETLAGYQPALTEGQLAAANSGVTTTTVSQVAANTQAIAIQDGLIAGKQATIDSEHKLSAGLVDGLATVATSGSYNDLANKPTIPTVDATLNTESTNAIQNAAVATALAGKADSATTLAGYGITDAYTKTQVDTALNAVSGDVGSIGTQISEALADYTTTSDLESTYATKAGVYPKEVSVPQSGQYVLGFVEGVQMYIPIVDANGDSGNAIAAVITEP